MSNKIPHRAAQKIRAFRNGTSPALTQEEMAVRLGVARLQVIRWEAGDAIASDEIKRRLHDMGVCEPNDWFRPAQCGLCERGLDDPAVQGCSRVGCEARRANCKPPLAA